jgi:hypothetical protein
MSDENKIFSEVSWEPRKSSGLTSLAEILDSVTKLSAAFAERMAEDIKQQADELARRGRGRR